MGIVCCNAPINSKEQSLLSKEDIEVDNLQNGHDEKSNENVISIKSMKSWDETKTEDLERELKREITKLHCQDLGDQRSILEDMDEDEEDEDDFGDTEFDKVTEQPDMSRPPSNLFRAHSRDLWKCGDLDEQENELLQQMRLLSASSVDP